MSMRTIKTVLAAALTVTLLACEKEEITRYEVVKDEAHKPPRSGVAEAPPALPRNPPPQPQGEQRLLGAITSHADQTWFIKLMGPGAAIATEADRFHAFVHSLQFSEDPQKPLAWTLPQGWREAPASPPRYATIQLGDGASPLELSVVAFPGEAGGFEANINRWRSQLGLPPITDGAELKAIAETHEVNGKQVIEIDMRGPGGSGEGAGPAASAGASFAPLAQGNQGAPPAGGQSLGPVIEKSPEDSPLTYQVPEGWREHAAGGIRTAEFSAGPQENPAVTTIIRLGGAAGGMPANVNRWRGQVGLEPLDPEELEKEAQRIEVAGEQAYYFDLNGPEAAGADRNRILAVIVQRGDTSWFIKMFGPSELVGKEKEKFERLARSIKFKE